MAATPACGNSPGPRQLPRSSEIKITSSAQTRVARVLLPLDDQPPTTLSSPTVPWHRISSNTPTSTPCFSWNVTLNNFDKNWADGQPVPKKISNDSRQFLGSGILTTAVALIS
ncbi:hypothetical protein O9992_21730 [Vibrio lentus]|nr:hypothetical protein [Vibrio lentus]